MSELLVRVLARAQEEVPFKLQHNRGEATMPLTLAVDHVMRVSDPALLVEDPGLRRTKKLAENALVLGIIQHTKLGYGSINQFEDWNKKTPEDIRTAYRLALAYVESLGSVATVPAPAVPSTHVARSVAPHPNGNSRSARA